MLRRERTPVMSNAVSARMPEKKNVNAKAGAQDYPSCLQVIKEF